MKKFVCYINILFLLITFTKSIAQSDGQATTLWDQVRFNNLTAGKSYEISSGTGFFVSSHYIVTNEHVVESCRNIAVRGAIQPSLVSIVAVDKDLDLAILYAEFPADKIAYLRANNELKYGENLFVVGYPLDSGKTGQALVKETQMLRVLPHSLKQFSTVEFTNIIEHGNSGGPLLDRNTNVVGVVRAKKTYYNPEQPDMVYQTSGVAIGLDGLIDFLHRHGVIYSSNTTYDMFTNYRLDQLAKDYIVNIHCVK